LRTFAVLTTKPNELVATLYDRMPVILHSAETTVGSVNNLIPPA
jgi:putative SOS response-associated peptidase YedK